MSSEWAEMSDREVGTKLYDYATGRALMEPWAVESLMKEAAQRLWRREADK